MTATVHSSIEEILLDTRVHDVDTHVVEPDNLWTSRMRKKWGDAVPHVAFDSKSSQRSWFVNGERCARAGMGVAGAATDVPYDEETTIAALDPHARLAWMDRHGVFSQLLYPNILGFSPRAFMGADLQLGIECCQAYNDFQTEFASADPERLITIANVPWWNVEAAMSELQRCHAMGHKGLNLGWEFEKLGLPRLRDSHWEPLLKTAEELDMPINFHVGFNSEDLPVDELRQQTTLDRVGWVATFFLGNAHCVSELIVGKICERYPTLKFVSVESGCGFLPFVIEALDWQFTATLARRANPGLLLPSEYFRRQIYGTFWFEQDISLVANLYPDNFMFESDFPHPTSLTPAPDLPDVKGPRDTIVANLRDVPETVVRKLLQDNAASVYCLAPASDLVEPT